MEYWVNCWWKMKPRYVIVNETEKQYFEKYFELPYGYNSCPIFFSFEEAKNYFDNVLSLEDQLNCIIERWNKIGEVELVYYKHLPSEEQVDKYILPATKIIKSNTIQ